MDITDRCRPRAAAGEEPGGDRDPALFPSPGSVGRLKFQKPCVFICGTGPHFELPAKGKAYVVSEFSKAEPLCEGIQRSDQEQTYEFRSILTSGHRCCRINLLSFRNGKFGDSSQTKLKGITPGCRIDLQRSFTLTPVQFLFYMNRTVVLWHSSPCTISQIDRIFYLGINCRIFLEALEP